MLHRRHYVIGYDPDSEEPWSVYDANDGKWVIANFAEFDEAVLRLRLLRGELAVGDLL